jgi:hypothetical protein
LLEPDREHVGELGRHGFWVCVGQSVVEAHARVDLELGEHLVQVVFDGAWAEEELGRDLEALA